MTKELSKNKYYLATHRYNGTQYRVMAPSKRKLGKILPQFDWSSTKWAGLQKDKQFTVITVWIVREIDEKKYRKMDQIVAELTWENTYEYKNEP